MVAERHTHTTGHLPLTATLTAIGNPPGADGHHGKLSFATVLYYKDRYGGGEGYVRSLKSRWDRFGKADIPIDLPVGQYTGEQYSAIIYGRAPLLLMALSDRMGEKAFGNLLARYARRFRWKIARAEDFARLAEEICGCSLDDLFRE